MSERNWGVFVAAGLIAGGALVLFFLVGIVGLKERLINAFGFAEMTA